MSLPDIMTRVSLSLTARGVEANVCGSNPAGFELRTFSFLISSETFLSFFVRIAWVHSCLLPCLAHDGSKNKCLYRTTSTKSKCVGGFLPFLTDAVRWNRMKGAQGTVLTRAHALKAARRTIAPVRGVVRYRHLFLTGLCPCREMSKARVEFRFPFWICSDTPPSFPSIGVLFYSLSEHGGCI